jgi:hypothetical protein
MVVDVSDGSEIINGSELISGTQLNLYPRTENAGSLRTANILLEDSTIYENSSYFSVTQALHPTPVMVNVAVIEDEVHYIEIVNNSGSNTGGYTYVTFQFFAMHPDYGGNVPFTMQYEFLKNGVSNGTGSLTVYNTSLTYTGDHMLTASDPGDVITILLWENPKP